MISFSNIKRIEENIEFLNMIKIDNFPKNPPVLSRHYKAYCERCRCITYVLNSSRKGGICYDCLDKDKNKKKSIISRL